MSIQDFALIDGKFAFIKDYRHLVGNYADRPLSICPIKGCGCEMEMVLPKDESIRHSHFRHKSKSIADHSPESIWHSGVKHHIAARLMDNAKIIIKWKCQSGFCKGKHNLPSMLSKNPNRFDVDSKKIGKFLPDITLYHDQTAVGVIEVFNTHESTEEKINYFNEIKLPWLEISIKSETDYKKITAWNTGSGLENFISKFYYPDDLSPHCPECTKILEEKRKNAEQAEKDRGERARRRQWFYEYKQKLADKLLKLVSNNERIPLGFSRNCYSCGKFSPHHITFRESVSFDIDDEKPIIEFTDSHGNLTGTVILNREKHPAKKKQSTGNFIEITVNDVQSTFKVIDSSLHFLKGQSHQCEECAKIQEIKYQKAIEQRKAEEEKREKEKILRTMNRIKQEEISILAYLNEATEKLIAIESQIKLFQEEIRTAKSFNDRETARKNLREAITERGKRTSARDQWKHALEYFEKAKPNILSLMSS